MHENEIGTAIVDCAVHLLQALGPGQLKSVYEVTLTRQLEKRGLSLQRQVPVPIVFEGEEFEEGFRADLVVENGFLWEQQNGHTCRRQNDGRTFSHPLWLG
jgi:GxxExxY protein